jgi:Uma2 family endonuclease
VPVREVFMSSQPITYLRPEEYLALERESEFKSEYLDGEIIAMTGASRQHNLISLNVGSELRQQLRGSPCEVYAGDMRVRVASARLYTYPDVVVACGEPRFEDEHVDTLLNPSLIVEVLSPSTELYDRGKKFRLYRTIDSLSEYLLVAQDECRVEQYARQKDGRWLLADYRSPDDSVELSSVGCRLALREVYEKVALPNSTQ